MVVTIHQPEHLPWFGFCHKAAQADVFVLLDNVQFRKNYFQNRNRILGPNGPLWITVPVLLKGHTKKTIREMEINNGVSWSEKWWKSLFYSYKSCKFFDEYAAFFESIPRRPWHYLAELNEAIIHYLFDALGLRCQILRASSLPVHGSRSALLRDICTYLGADVYLAGQYGRDYLDEALFQEKEIGVRYHAFTHPVYPQRDSREFVTNLSVVDLLFNCGPQSGEVIRSAALEVTE